LKQLFRAVFVHLQQSFNGWLYGFCILVMAVSCYLNYYTGVSLWPVRNSFGVSFAQTALLFFFFFDCAFLMTVFSKKINVDWRKRHVLIVVIAPVLFALRVCLPFDEWIFSNSSSSFQRAFHKPASWLGGLLFIVPAIAVIHFYFEGKAKLYFIKKTKTIAPYLVLLLCMLPLLLLASQWHAFELVYPRSKDVAAALGTNTTPVHYLLFESSYALDFITIELFFRGLLIATLSRVLGVHAIVPVALFYFSIHLGKPMMEAISSFFGGLILGAVSYETKSIWGGWLVHCGIALIMELLGYVMQ
jgi:Type II CAAX prenyl endopeptidase Rce1-like